MPAPVNTGSAGVQDSIPIRFSGKGCFTGAAHAQQAASSGDACAAGAGNVPYSLLVLRRLPDWPGFRPTSR
jgi:hypothetical protein